MLNINFMFGIWTLWILMNLPDTVAVGAAVCGSLRHFPVSQPGFRLHGSTFSTVANTSVILCAQECLLMSACCTFNFHLLTGQCELNTLCGPDNTGDVTLLSNATSYIWSTASNWNQNLLDTCVGNNCSWNARCVPAIGGYTCTITHCAVPEITDVVVPDIHNVSLFPIGQVLKYKCSHGFSHCGELECRHDGSWANISCLPVQSCSDLKAFNPTYGDGEYWLQFPSVPGVKMKVYCHNMDTSPQEYITLVTPYVVDTPRLTNENCTDPVPYEELDSNVGKFTYTKVGIKLLTMSVAKGDKTFYTSDLKDFDRSFGNVMDCYTPYNNPCGPIGRGVIDMRGTGWKLTDQVVWEGLGNAEFPPNVTRSHNGQVIEIRCGGFCGSCYIFGKGWLENEQTDVLPLASAVVPKCDSITEGVVSSPYL